MRPGLPSLSTQLVLDTYNKGHSVVLCPSHCCVIWPAGGSPPAPTSRLCLVNHLAREEREIRFGCSGEIQLFTGTNPVTELVARGDRCDTLWSRGATSRLNCWHYTGDNILVTLYASHNMLPGETLLMTLISHVSKDTIQYFEGSDGLIPISNHW